MSKLSVVTLTRNRDQHLQKLIEGLRRSDISPGELIVVDMGDQPARLPPAPFPMFQSRLSGAVLPLAAARNLGAHAAQGELLLFLDVDCIPRRNLIATMIDALEKRDALTCAEVKYLSEQDRHLEDEEDLSRVAIAHPVRDFPASGARFEANPGLFWSLCFGIRRDTFMVLGGFDEQFVGYGAEDTDFGFRAAEAALPLLFLGGTGCFHQYHDVYSPPLQHLSDIVRNANRFYAKWNKWPMEGWLQDFEAMGLVQFNKSSVVQVRNATTSEINSARQAVAVRF